MSLSLDGKPLGCAFHILSDVFDILSHIAYDRNMKTRQHRAEVGRRRVEDQFDPKVVAFLDYILESYVESGAGQLDRSKLADFARIKVSVRCAPPNGCVSGVLVSTIDSGHLGALYGGKAEEAALAG
jgi:hypothetical protein